MSWKSMEISSASSEVTVSALERATMAAEVVPLSSLSEISEPSTIQNRIRRDVEELDDVILGLGCCGSCITIAIVIFIVCQLIILTYEPQCNYKTCHGFDVVKPIQMSITNVEDGVCCIYQAGYGSPCNAGREYPCTKYKIHANLPDNQVCNFFYKQDTTATLESVVNFTINAVNDEQFHLLRKKQSDICLDSFANEHCDGSKFQLHVFWTVIVFLSCAAIGCLISICAACSKYIKKHETYTQ